jgi:hypothetical protein
LFKNFNQQFTKDGTVSEKDGVNFIAKPSFCVGTQKTNSLPVRCTANGPDGCIGKKMQQVLLTLLPS